MNYPDHLPTTCPTCGAEARDTLDKRYNVSSFICGGRLERNKNTGDTHFSTPCPAKPLDTDGWIEWGGGECPVPSGMQFEVRFQNGLKRVREAPCFAWGSDIGAWGIVAYRILSAPTTITPPEWSKGWHNPKKAKEPGEGFRFILCEERGKLSDVIVQYYDAAGRWEGSGGVQGDCEYNTYRVPISTPFPGAEKTWSVTPKQPWSLPAHLARHWPDWGDRKPHRDDFTEEMLSGSDGPWRPLFEGELDEEGDWMESAISGKWGPVGSIHVNLGRYSVHHRTKRPLPALERPKAWRPQIGEWYQWRKPKMGIFDWSTGACLCASDYFTRLHNDYEFRRAFPSESITQLSERPINTIIATETKPEMGAITRTSFTARITEPEPEHTMQTSNTQTATPSVELPDIGSVWDIQYANDADKSFKGTIIGRNEDAVTIKSRSRIPFFPDITVIKRPDWNSRPKAIRGQVKAQPNSPVFNIRTGPSLLKSLRTRAMYLTIGTVASPFTIPLIKTGIAFLASFFAQWMSK